MKPRSFRLLGLTLALALSSSGCSSVALDDILEVPGAGPAELDRDTVIAGLREALEIGSTRAVNRTAVVDGFFGNELIRILIPADLETMATRLRQLAMGRQIDELELGMNRAAEQAAGEARAVLWQEIRGLTFPDAMAILRGGPTAATGFLQLHTANEIRVRFHPIVVGKMEDLGLARLYADVADRYSRLPFVTRPAVDLEEYVTDRALAGLFTVLGEEEKRIRENPVARAPPSCSGACSARDDAEPLARGHRVGHPAADWRDRLQVREHGDATLPDRCFGDGRFG